MSGFLQEFKKFALKGNVVDMAVGIIIGAAFGKIVSSVVDNLIMPPLGLLIGGVDFSRLRIILKAAGADGKGEVAISYGLFLGHVIDFTIIAFSLFVVIRIINHFHSESEAPAAPAAPPEDVTLLREIRDLLRGRAQ